MIDYLLFWLAKVLVENALGLFVLGILSLWWLRVLFAQLMCKHKKYYEDRKCNAICKKCGATLGFIGTIRAKEREAELNEQAKKSKGQTNNANW